MVSIGRPRRGAAKSSPTRGRHHRDDADLYDYGVYREDAALQRSLSTLEGAGWLRSGYRIGITADHGEMLMEHPALVEQLRALGYVE